jgi:hypothetical protein
MSAFRHEGMKAAIRLRLEGPAAAAAAVDEALRLYRADPTPMYATYWAVANLLETALGLWRRQGSRGRPPVAVRETQLLMRRFARLFPMARSRHALLLGHARWLVDDQAGAVRQWRRAEAIGARLEMAYDVQLAREALAQPAAIGVMRVAGSDDSPFDQPAGM